LAGKPARAPFCPEQKRAFLGALAFALFQTILLALLAAAWGRWAASASAAAEVQSARSIKL
jgi:hypothetical protein